MPYLKIKIIKNPILTMIIFSLFIFIVISKKVLGEENRNEQIKLVVGEQKLIEYSNIDKVSIGDPNIADIQVVQNSQVLIIGKGEGNTSIIIWNKEGKTSIVRLEVQSTDPKKLIEELKEILGNIEGLSLKIVGNKVVMEGSLLSKEEYEKVIKVSELYGNKILNFVKLNPNYNKILADKINKAFKDAGIYGVTIRYEGNTFFLEGSVPDEKIAQKAMAIASSMLKSDNNISNLVESE